MNEFDPKDSGFGCGWNLPSASSTCIRNYLVLVSNVRAPIRRNIASGIVSVQATKVGHGWHGTFNP